MFRKVCDINGIPVYEDIYMDDNKILTHFSEDKKRDFFIAGRKVCQVLSSYVKMENRDKLISDLLNSQ